MSSNIKQSTQSGQSTQDDEVGDAALDAVSGGQGAQPIQKLDTMVVTATRLPPSGASVQKLDTMVVTATRLPTDLSGAQLASASVPVKKGS